MSSCGCGATFGGARRCHCAGCHETFSSVRAFDMHRAGHFAWGGMPGTRHCVSPGDLRDQNGQPRLTQDTSGVWHRPAASPERTAKRLGGLRPYPTKGEH